MRICSTVAGETLPVLGETWTTGPSISLKKIAADNQGGYDQQN
ncbi:MAG: hypothetical protein ACLU98_03215 [Desulfovibrio fairfieldensis]